MKTTKELFEEHQHNIDFINGGLELLLRADGDTVGGEGLFWPVIGEIKSRFKKLVEDIKGDPCE